MNTVATGVEMWLILLMQVIPVRYIFLIFLDYFQKIRSPTADVFISLLP